MNRRQMLSLFIIVGIMLSNLGQSDMKLSRGDPPRYYCGRDLARAVAAACYGEPAASGAGKRSGPVTMYNPLLLPYYYSHKAQHQDRYNEVDGPWMSPHKARAMSGPRGKRGVVDECCIKPCDLDELITYC